MKNAKKTTEVIKKDTSPQTKDLPLVGKIFVFTGELENFTRAKATQLVESLGGKVGSSVSSKTTYVVVGDEPGSKLTKAKELNIPILTETEFIQMTE